MPATLSTHVLDTAPDKPAADARRFDGPPEVLPATLARGKEQMPLPFTLEVLERLAAHHG